MSRFQFKILKDKEKQREDFATANDPSTPPEKLHELFDSQQNLGFKNKFVKAIAKNPNSSVKTLTKISKMYSNYTPHVLRNSGLKLNILTGIEDEKDLYDLTGEALNHKDYEKFKSDQKDTVSALRNSLPYNDKLHLAALDHNANEDEIAKSIDYRHQNLYLNDHDFHREWHHDFSDRKQEFFKYAKNPNTSVKSLAKISKIIPNDVLLNPKLHDPENHKLPDFEHHLSKILKNHDDYSKLEKNSVHPPEVYRAHKDNLIKTHPMPNAALHFAAEYKNTSPETIQHVLNRNNPGEIEHRPNIFIHKNFSKSMISDPKKQNVYDNFIKRSHYNAIHNPHDIHDVNSDYLTDHYNSVEDFKKQQIVTDLLAQHPDKENHHSPLIKNHLEKHGDGGLYVKKSKDMANKFYKKSIDNYHNKNRLGIAVPGTDLSEFDF